MGAKRCLVLGSPKLQQMITDAGLTVADEPEVDAVVVGLDLELTYDRLRLACDAVGRCGAAFVALHRNRSFTDAQGRNSPSVGATVEAIRYATRAEPIVVGKPSRDYYSQVLSSMQVPTEAVMVVSDDPFSDLAGARRMGMQAAFVLSGKYDDADVIKSIDPAERPQITVDRIGDLLTRGLLAD